MTLEPFLAVEDGWQSLIDGAIQATAPPVAPGVIFGMNVGDGVGARNDLTTRTTDFGTIPICRSPYYSTLPAAFDASLYTLRSPNKRMVISFDVAPATITSGGYDSQITAWAESTAADSWTALVYKSEPNNHISGGEYTAAQYIAALGHIGALLDSLESADRVVPAATMSAPKSYNDGVKWDDSWMPTYSQFNNERAMFFWDNYGNPHGGTGLDGDYPPVQDVQDRALGLLDAKGWNEPGFGHTGRTEFNAPMRNFDTSEVQRAQWITDYCNYALDQPVPPKIMCLWNGTNGNWDQDFHTSLPAAAYKAFVETSA